MPFIYDESEVECPDDGTEPAPPRPDQFVYLAPLEYGGAPEPVRFSTVAFTQASAPPPPRQEDRRERRRQRLFAVVIPELRAIGARRAYCRYDGGHDEGFSWLDSIEMEDGARITAAELAQRPQGADLLNKIYAAELMRPADAMHAMPGTHPLEVFFYNFLCQEWASMLLADGYGTGEYWMYGAFTVDLETGTITDDPAADPIVQNITVAQ